MPYIESININTEKTMPFPYNVPAVKYAKNISLNSPVSFIIGDNGTGKSTLIETIAYRLQLPHMDGSSYSKKCFEASKKLVEYLDIKYKIERTIGFFFRAEDFGDFLNSIDRTGEQLYKNLEDLKGHVPDHVIDEMVESANSQLHHVRLNYGQDLNSFSHGEAYLKIIQEKIKSRGIYILDEPEAALSPAKQLSLIHFIMEHLKSYNSQFIIATHSPILMSMPNSILYEIDESGMTKRNVEDTEHYSITKSFLNNPEMYLRHL